MKYIHINHKRYFSLGIDEETNKYYLSIPLDKGTMTCSECYLIPETIVAGYPANIDEVEKFVAECRAGNMFHLSKERIGDDYKKNAVD